MQDPVESRFASLHAASACLAIDVRVFLNFDDIATLISPGSKTPVDVATVETEISPLTEAVGSTPTYCDADDTAAGSGGFLRGEISISVSIEEDATL